ncbi:MAG: hypothetical protein M3Y33_19540, partial [Actinomycetota bacterium]|nr:hypothetical protein [Actinomycetota bacterium]
ADAVDLVLAGPPLAAPVGYDVAVYGSDGGTGPPGAQTVALNFTVSPACLLGVCGGGGCRSPLCEHACHSRPA